MEVVSSLPQASPNIEVGQSNHLRPRSVIKWLEPTNPAQDLLRRIKSATIEKYGGSTIGVSSPVNTEGLSTPDRRSDAEGSSYGSDRVSRSLSLGSGYSTCSSSDVPLVPCVWTEGSENGFDSSAVPQFKEDRHHSSPPSVLVCAKLYGTYMFMLWSMCTF